MHIYMCSSVDHSRVILRLPDDNGSDYINASYIEVRIYREIELLTVGLLWQYSCSNICIVIGANYHINSKNAIG